MAAIQSSLFETALTDDASGSLGTGVLFVGEVRESLKQIDDETFETCITSPPYWGLRDYGIEGQIGGEWTVEEYVVHLVETFREVRRTLRDDGTVWLNIGDSYTSGGRTWRDPDKKLKARGMSYRPPTPDGLKPKDLIGVPWRVAFALQADGWWLRSNIVWHKPNAQPESVKDRPSNCHEMIFLLTKSQDYAYDYTAMMEPSLNGQSRRARRSVWSINTEPFPDAHFATFPRALVEPCLLAGSRPRGIVLDPFFGSGTVGEVAARLGRDFIGVELNPEYAEVAQRRIESALGPSVIRVAMS